MTRFDALGIVASDVGATVAFYSLLGFDFGDATDGGHVEAPMGGGLRLMIDTEDMAVSLGDWQAPTGDGRVTLALVCDSPADVDAAHARVVAAGYRSRTDPFDAPWGQRYATVLDPDGNAIDLFASLEP